LNRGHWTDTAERQERPVNMPAAQKCDKTVCGRARASMRHALQHWQTSIHFAPRHAPAKRTWCQVSVEKTLSTTFCTAVQGLGFRVQGIGFTATVDFVSPSRGVSTKREHGSVLAMQTPDRHKRTGRCKEALQLGAGMCAARKLSVAQSRAPVEQLTVRVRSLAAPRAGVSTLRGAPRAHLHYPTRQANASSPVNQNQDAPPGNSNLSRATRLWRRARGRNGPLHRAC
jgi:hypothetical protein